MQNHINDSGIALCERILLLRGGGEEGTNDEEKLKGKRKNPAGDREAKDSEDKERPRRFAAQQQEPPLKWGRHLLLAHASIKPSRTDTQQGGKYEQSINQLTNRPYLSIQADQIHYFAARAHYQIDKAKTKLIDRSTRSQDSCAVNTMPPPKGSLQMDDKEKCQATRTKEGYKLSGTDHHNKQRMTDRKGNRYRKRIKAWERKIRSRDKQIFWNTCLGNIAGIRRNTSIH